MNGWDFCYQLGTPEEVVIKLHDAVAAVVREGDFRKPIEDAGALSIGSTPATFVKLFQKDSAKRTGLIRNGKNKVH